MPLENKNKYIEILYMDIKNNLTTQNIDKPQMVFFHNHFEQCGALR